MIQKLEIGGHQLQITLTEAGDLTVERLKDGETIFVAAGTVCDREVREAEGGSHISVRLPYTAPVIDPAKSVFADADRVNA